MIDVIITFLFLIYFSLADIKKREVENLPILIFLFFAIGLIILNFIYGRSVYLILSVMLIVVGIPFIFFFYFAGALGGADTKILLVMLLLFPFYLFPIFFLSGFFTLFYTAAAKHSVFNKILKIEKGVPYCVCVLMSFSLVVFFIWLF